MRLFRTEQTCVCVCRRGVAPLLIALAVLALPAYAAFPNGYSYCKVVTTQHSMVSGSSDLTNYPLTVILTDADLKTTANGGLVTNASGYDIGFYPDCSGTGTALKWEMESYSPSTGAILAHVLRPTLSHVTDDTIGMFYGGGFSSFQSTGSAVWDSNYKGVWHFPDGTTLTTPSPDSTSAANSATPTTGVMGVAGQLGGAVWLDGSNTHNLSGGASWPSTWTTLTYSAWFRVTNLIREMVLFQSSSGANGWGVAIQPNTGQMDWYSRGIADNNFSSLTVSANKTYYFAVTRNGGTVIGTLYNATDGTSATQTLSGVGSPNNGNGGFLMGDFDLGIAPLAGWMDELRVSNSVRSPDWILTEYRNQSAPGTYLSVGPRSGTVQKIRHSVKTDG